MKVFEDYDVLTAARQRIRYLLDEFDDVMVSVSGGKDSTIVFNLMLEACRERGRLPMKVYFLDQEFEYQSTIDMIHEWMYTPDVEPYWYQIEIRMMNANSPYMPWVTVWGEDRREGWMRDKDPVARLERFSKADRFHTLMHDFTDYMAETTGRKTCIVTGMRAEESFNRFRGITSNLTYKGVSWGKKNRKSFVFHPIYDWTFTDVWKYIYDNKIRYNTAYDRFYQLGFSTTNMRVSNLIHEYTYHSVIYLQEIEPRTYERITKALPGISATAKFAEDFMPTKLPDMFTSWIEYRDYLLKNMIPPEWQPAFRKVWSTNAETEANAKLHIKEIMLNDVSGTINANRMAKGDIERKKGGQTLQGGA